MVSNIPITYLPLSDCIRKIANIKWKDLTKEDCFGYLNLASVDLETHLIGEVPTINCTNAPSRAQQIVCPGDILFGTTCPLLKRYCIIPEMGSKLIASTGYCVLRANEDMVLSSWILHNISSSKFYEHVEKYQKGTIYPAISDSEVKSYHIPVPPIEMQREIVRILDSFTELTMELTMELTARRKQYEYYRDKLLSFPEQSA